MLNDFDGKVVLVTGAGSGIGREAAIEFAARGGFVFGADLNEKGLAETEHLITQAGGRAQVGRVDVSSEGDVSAFLSRIDAEAGRLDVAFNNAGNRRRRASDRGLPDGGLRHGSTNSTCAASSCA